jgi:hypothetical protein
LLTADDLAKPALGVDGEHGRLPRELRGDAELELPKRRVPITSSPVGLGQKEVAERARVRLTSVENEACVLIDLAEHRPLS